MSKIQGSDVRVAGDSIISIKFPEDSDFKEINSIRLLSEERDNTIESFLLYGDEGYYSNFKTAQNVKYSFELVRQAEDPVHQELIERGSKVGKEALATIQIQTSTETIIHDVAIDLANSGFSGEAADLLAITGTFHGTGKPTIEKGTGFAKNLRVKE